MAMAPFQSSLYGPIPLRPPVSILFLIENSLAMQVAWKDLRDQYLLSLVDNLTRAHIEAGTPITVSVLESYPCQDHGPNPSLPRQYSDQHDGLFDDIMFSTNPENKISIGRINSCIDILDSCQFQGQPAALHLVIVAATVPSDDTAETPTTGNDYSPWIFLAKKMADKHIHCHIVVSPQHDTGSLTMLFEETLRLQTNVEGQLYPPADPTRTVVRISVTPSQQQFTDAVSASLYPMQRMPLTRRSSNPAESFYSDTFEPANTQSANDSEPAPSLVTQLQQVHGLTKKKVYGAKPTRAPFFREERVHNKFRAAPTPLTMPLPVVDQAPSPTAGGRAISQSRADRMARVGQGSPTELHSRRPHGWPRRGSRLSTPEPDNLTWPPASPSTFQDTSPRSSYISSVSSDISSPVTPVATMDDMYGIPKPIASGTSTPMHGMPPPAMMAGYQGAMSEPTWQPQPQQQPQQVKYTDVYGTVSTAYYSPPQQPPPPHYFSNNGEYSLKNDMVVDQCPPVSAPPALGTSPYDTYGVDATSSMMPPPQIPPPNGVPAPVAVAQPIPVSVPPVPSPATQRDSGSRSGPPKRAAQPEQPDDEERFTFSEDFVAATAALFNEEVVPAYPNYPGLSSNLLPRGSSMPFPLQSSAQAGELYASRVRTGNYASAPTSSSMYKQGMMAQNGIAPMQNGPYTHMNGHAQPYGHSHPQAHARAIPYANGYVGNAYPAHSYNAPAHQPAYNGSSLTGWAG